MDPNSAHQTWSRWTFGVVPGVRKHRSVREVRDHCKRFTAKAFGSATSMRIDQVLIHGVHCVKIDVRTEGHPVNDPQYVEWMAAQFRRFFTEGFGPGTVMRLETKLEAGSRQDGTPSEQLIILPSIAIEGVTSHE
jgi:hypothetical protein